MKEVACQFGEQNRLNGIVTLPNGSAQSARAMILVSAGLTSKAGPYRLYAELARQLASRGITTLRFDLGGIGNSEPAEIGLPLSERTAGDISEAVNFIRQRGSTHLLIGGLCSGAEDAFRYAASDPCIRGVFMLDPHAFRTVGWWLRNLFSRHFVKSVVPGVFRLTGLMSATGLANAPLSSRESEGSLIDYQYMGCAEASRALRILMNRGTRVHYVYTGNRSDAFNHEQQLTNMFDGLTPDETVTVAHFPFLEHTQILTHDRRLIISSVSDWADQASSSEQPELDDEALALAGQ